MFKMSRGRRNKMGQLAVMVLFITPVLIELTLVLVHAVWQVITYKEERDNESINSVVGTGWGATVRGYTRTSRRKLRTYVKRCKHAAGVLSRRVRGTKDN